MQLLNVMVGSNGGAGMGAYTLVGSVVGTVWGCFALLQARAPHTRTKDTRRAVEGRWQDRDATQRNLGEEMRAWERESRPGERSREDTGKRHDQGKNRLLTYCMKLSK